MSRIRRDQFMGLDGFVWFMGVVEDRLDPLRLGRVRVRCFGWHDGDSTTLPRDKLPWAQVMMSSMSASVSGIGDGPSKFVEGSWVIGFFADGKRAQFPIVIGSIHGVPYSTGISKLSGFRDPNGVYPKYRGESDVNRLARDTLEAETHPSLISKRNARTTLVPKASRHYANTVHQPLTSSYYESETWNEPPARGATGFTVYPLNQVKESESGHTFEIDDSPGHRRIHEYHAAGTYKEIQDDGTRVTRVVGDDYEIIVRDKNVLVRGECSVTVQGDCRLRVEGDMVTEVDGNYHLTVRGDMVTKVGWNDAKEVLGDSSTQINGNKTQRVSKDAVDIVGLSRSDSVGKSMSLDIAENLSQKTSGNTAIIAAGSRNMIAAVGTIDIGSAGNMSIATNSKLAVKSMSDTKMQAVGSFLIKSDDVNLGDTGGALISRIGDRDSANQPLVEGSSKVRAA